MESEQRKKYKIILYVRTVEEYRIFKDFILTEKSIDFIDPPVLTLEVPDLDVVFYGFTVALLNEEEKLFLRLHFPVIFELCSETGTE